MQNALTIPGAAVMYHTMEFNEPLDLSAKGQKRKSDDPRRHYVTPLDTNTPTQYSPPSPKSYEAEYTHVVTFAFLVDDKGAVHVRPFDTSTCLHDPRAQHDHGDHVSGAALNTGRYRRPNSEPRRFRRCIEAGEIAVTRYI